MHSFLVRAFAHSLAALGIGVLVPIAVASQAPPQSASGPTVSVHGTGVLQLDPDYAEIVLGVEVQAPSADIAASDMSSRLNAVGDTLASLGFPPDSFPRTAFAVRPRYDPTQGRQLVGFDAAVSLTLRTTDLDNLAALIGAALGAGATTVSSVRFESTQSDEAHIQALEQAFERSRQQAEILAQSSGFTLGTPLAITTPSQANPLSIRGVVGGAAIQQFMSISAYAVRPQQVEVRATVTVVWQLIPS